MSDKLEFNLPPYGGVLPCEWKYKVTVLYEDGTQETAQAGKFKWNPSKAKPCKIITGWRYPNGRK